MMMPTALGTLRGPMAKLTILLWLNWLWIWREHFSSAWKSKNRNKILVKFGWKGPGDSWNVFLETSGSLQPPWPHSKTRPKEGNLILLTETSVKRLKKNRENVLYGPIPEPMSKAGFISRFLVLHFLFSSGPMKGCALEMHGCHR